MSPKGLGLGILRFASFRDYVPFGVSDTVVGTREGLLVVGTGLTGVVVAVTSLLPALLPALPPSLAPWESSCSSFAARRIEPVHWLIYFDFDMPTGIVPPAFSVL